MFNLYRAFDDPLCNSLNRQGQENKEFLVNIYYLPFAFLISNSPGGSQAVITCSFIGHAALRTQKWDTSHDQLSPPLQHLF